MNNYFVILDSCVNVDLLLLLSILRGFVDFMKVVFPVILVIMISVDLVKATISGSQDEIAKSTKKIPNRLLLGALVVLLPTLFEFVFSNIDSSNQAIACFNSATKENVQIAYQDLALRLISEAESRLASNPKEAWISMDTWDAIRNIDDFELKESLQSRADSIQASINQAHKSGSGYYDGPISGGGGGSYSYSYTGSTSCNQKTINTTNAIVNKAQSLLCTPYRWGHSSPSTGFDCSHFVSYVLGIGYRTANAYKDYGTAVSSLSMAQPGDLIVTYRPGRSGHVGIYAGIVDGKHQYINASGGTNCPNGKSNSCMVKFTTVPTNSNVYIRRP